MRKSGCNRRKLRVQARPRNGDISLFQRFLKMGASTAACIWQIAESILSCNDRERQLCDMRDITERLLSVEPESVESCLSGIRQFVTKRLSDLQGLLSSRMTSGEGQN